MSYSIEDALAELGVTSESLNVSQCRALNEEGFVILEGIIDRPQLEECRHAFEEIWASELNGTGKETGTRHPSDLLNRNRVFIEPLLEAPTLAALYQVLGRPFRLTQCAGRDPLPGFGQQGLHTDWMPRAAGEPFFVATTILVLDDFENNNGSTRLVPRSHQLMGGVPKKLADPAAHHPDEVVATAPAGSVLIFNGHVWHSGRRNESTRSRRAIQSVFHAREVVPPFAEPLHKQLEALPRAVAFLLGGE